MAYGSFRRTILTNIDSSSIIVENVCLESEGFDMSSEKTPEQRNQEQLTTEMGLIIHGGNAKSLSFEAIYAAKKGDFEQAYQKLKEADEELLNAHQTQTQMLTQEAAGHPIEVHLLTIHSQDHLMNALTFRELAEEMVELHKELALIKAQL